MKQYKFFCDGHNAPAYSCDTPGDNSGVYYKKEDVDKLSIEIINIQVDNTAENLVIDTGKRAYALGRILSQIIKLAYQLGHRDARHTAAELVFIKERENEKG